MLMKPFLVLLGNSGLTTSKNAFINPEFTLMVIQVKGVTARALDVQALRK